MTTTTTLPANNGTIGRAAGSTVTSSPAPMTNGLGLGGLFAGGMPKLRATGIQLGERTLIAVGNVPMIIHAFIVCYSVQFQHLVSCISKV